MLKEHFLKEQNIYYILQIDSNPVLQNELPRTRIDPSDLSFNCMICSSGFFLIRYKISNCNLRLVSGETACKLDFIIQCFLFIF